MSEPHAHDGLNERQKLHVLATLRHVDQLLAEAEHIMASASGNAAFPRFIADITPVQRRVLDDSFARLRQAMVQALATLEAPSSEANVSMVRALHVQLTSASIALEEAHSPGMRGYGALLPAAAERLDRTLDAVQRLVERIDGFLAQPADRDPAARLARLAATRDEAKLLAELARVITAHGMVELRGVVAALADELESESFQVAVFGRVSAGKSSLLNYLLRHPVLPVGVTPITAVPTVVAWGREPRALVEFADASPQVVPIERLGEFASEAANPGNVRHVTRLRVELPEPRIAKGITFVDTPGLGSLATAGAAEALAYLPRCDLGLVLVDAGAALGPEDVAIVRALHETAARAMVLVSKADLLAAPERERVVAYTRQALGDACGVEVPVFAVSVIGDNAALADAWFEAELHPLCLEQARAARMAVRRKAGALREAVVGVLRARLERASAGPAVEAAVARVRVESIEDEAAVALARAEEECRMGLSTFAEAGEAVLDEAAAVLAAGAIRRWEGTAGEVVARIAARHAAETGRALAHATNRLRLALTKGLAKLEEGSAALAAPGDGLPRAAGLPVLDLSPLDRGATVPVSRLLLWAPRFLVRKTFRRRLAAALGPALADLVRVHRARLAEWIRDALAELQRAFEARADAARASGAGGVAATASEDRAAIARDIASLAAWDAQAASAAGRRNVSAEG